MQIHQVLMGNSSRRRAFAQGYLDAPTHVRIGAARRVERVAAREENVEDHTEAVPTRATIQRERERERETVNAESEQEAEQEAVERQALRTHHPLWGCGDTQPPSLHHLGTSVHLAPI